VRRSRPYYPRTKGKIERTIRNIDEEYVRLYARIDDETLEDFIFWYNVARFHDGIRTTPVERYLGFKVAYGKSGKRLLALVIRAVADPSMERLRDLAAFRESMICAKCGGRTIRYGYYRKFGLFFQRYRCCECGATFSTWSLLLRAVRKRYPRCRVCGTNDFVIKWNARGSRRWKCTACGRTFSANVEWLHEAWLRTT